MLDFRHNFIYKHIIYIYNINQPSRGPASHHIYPYLTISHMSECQEPLSGIPAKTKVWMTFQCSQLHLVSQRSVVRVWRAGLGNWCSWKKQWCSPKHIQKAVYVDVCWCWYYIERSMFYWLISWLDFRLAYVVTNSFHTIHTASEPGQRKVWTCPGNTKTSKTS